MSEMWKRHPEFTDYAVSDQGRVKRLTAAKGATPGTILVGAINRDTGYRIVRLYGRITRSVHRLVLEAFVGQRPHGKEARHLDGNSTNNALSNLCWGTNAENHADRIIHGRSTISAAKLAERDVTNIRDRSTKGATAEELAKEFAVSANHVRGVLSRRYWKHI